MNIVPHFRNSPFLVLILSIITCGIYLLYFNYKLAQVINALAGRKVIDEFLALIAPICLPLNLYFYYIFGSDALPLIYQKSGQSDKGVSTEKILLLVLCVIFPVVAAMIAQHELNKMYDK